MQSRERIKQDIRSNEEHEEAKSFGNHAIYGNVKAGEGRKSQKPRPYKGGAGPGVLVNRPRMGGKRAGPSKATAFITM